MREIISSERLEMLEKEEPYLHFEEGKGMVLDEDAPEEIVKLREKTLQMAREAKLKNTT